VLASALPVVLFVGMVMAGVIGAMSLAARKDVYDEIERGRLSVDRDRASEADTETEVTEQAADADPRSERAERELEIRQMLEARNARRIRNGDAPLDIDAELARLTPVAGTASAVTEEGPESAEQELEIRQMLEARNARRIRNGGAPLDIDAELARLLGRQQ